MKAETKVLLRCVALVMGCLLPQACTPSKDNSSAASEGAKSHIPPTNAASQKAGAQVYFDRGDLDVSVTGHRVEGRRTLSVSLTNTSNRAIYLDRDLILLLNLIVRTPDGFPATEPVPGQTVQMKMAPDELRGRIIALSPGMSVRRDIDIDKPFETFVFFDSGIGGHDPRLVDAIVCEERLERLKAGALVGDITVRYGSTKTSTRRALQQFMGNDEMAAEIENAVKEVTVTLPPDWK